jgi:adenine deaminase
LNDPADFIVVDSLIEFNILQTWINGELVAENGKSLITTPAEKPINYFQAEKVQAEDFLLPAESSTIRVIDVRDGELVTGSSTHFLGESQWAEPDPKNDVLKIAVVNRYQMQKPALAFVRNFGIRNGAIASSVAHDSHNIIAVGTSNQTLAAAVNLVIEKKGGISAVMDEEEKILPLPVAGLMSLEDGYTVARKYQEIDRFVKEKGCSLRSPFMTLSFLALLVIPELKLSDLGLFNAESFRFESVFIK